MYFYFNTSTKNRIDASGQNSSIDINEYIYGAIIIVITETLPFSAHINQY